MFATNLEGGSVLGIDTVRSVDEVPDGEADLAFVCTPAAANVALLKSCAARGVQAAFVTSAGYAEAGGDGERAQGRARRRGRGRGHPARGSERAGARVDPARLCAQIVGPYPPAGRIGLASQSGNLASALMNMAVASGVGISRAISAGNAAMASVGDYLEWFARGRRDGGRPRLRRRDRRRPRVLRTDAQRRAEQARRAGEGWCDRGRPASRRVAHGRARQRRSDLRRHVPAGRLDASDDDRGGVRGRGDVRDAAVAEGTRTPRW